MRPFAYLRPASMAEAVKAGGAYLAGGTTLLDLMKLDVLRPERVVDLGGLQGDRGAIFLDARGLRLGAGVTMAEAADHPGIRRQFPMLAQSLALAASAQLRNMATLGGNVLQRTRCSYYRDPGWSECNRRTPGSGCAALSGMNRMHAVLGASEQCIATYPGDFAQALVALDAQVDLLGPLGARHLPFSELHRRPAATPHVETTLRPGEMITGYRVPTGPWTRRSLYLKIRDRQSYAFALASAAVGLDIVDGRVREARIALGGVATIPWRSREAEHALAGRRIDADSAAQAARAAFADAVPAAHNGYKIALGQRTLVRALLAAAALET